MPLLRLRIVDRRRWALRLLPWLLLGLLRISAAEAQHFVMSSYGVSSGLANLNVSALLEDHTGAVWVGTESGVYLADGEHFHKQKAFAEAGLEFIRVLREDGAGRIWAVDSRHLVYWDGHSVHVIHGLSLKVLASEAIDLVSLPGDPGTMYLMWGGELWKIQTVDGGDSWTVSTALRQSLIAQHPELRTLTSIARGGLATLWTGCGNRVCKVDLIRQTAESFGVQDGVPADSWKGLLVTRSGSLWVRGEKNVLTRGSSGGRFIRMHRLPAADSLAVQSAQMVEDPFGNVLLNTSHGLARSAGTHWCVYTHTNGLPEDAAETLLFDRAGVLWITPQGHGIARWPGYGNWEGWSKAEGLGNNVVWSIAGGEKGPVWMTTDAGLDRLEWGTNRVVHQRTSSAETRLRAVVVDERGHVWTGDSAGEVIDFDPRTGRVRVAATDFGAVLQLLIDSRKRIWVCSRKGLHYFSRDDAWTRPRAIESQVLPPGYAWSMAESRSGTLWLSNGHGLFRLDGDAWTAIEIPFPGGRDYNFLLAAAADETLWVQSKLPFPLLHLKVTGSRAVVLDRVVGATFGSDNITFVVIDPRGWLWVGADDGVHVFNGERWVQCTTEDGLLWDDTDFHAFHADKDGSVWIGTSAGLSHLLHPERLFAQSAPELRVVEARVGEVDLQGVSPRFDLRRPALKVDLLNTNYSRGSGVIYRYRLEGQDAEWQEEHTDSLRFRALDAGSYRLSAVAYDMRLHTSSAPLSLAFTVLEPWWKRGWFRVVEGVCALLLLLGLWRFSVHLLMARQQTLERLVASRTRELELEKAQLLNTRSALLEMTQRDSLTGLLNRATIFERMNDLCEAALVTGRPLAVAMADLDSFKRINDEYGHVAGDTVLRECARRIEGAIRPEDAVGRYGGEELLILMPGLLAESAANRLEQLRKAIAAEPIMQGERELTVTCSFGVAWSEGQRRSLESLVGLADAALYLAKQNGRNRVEFASGHATGTPPEQLNREALPASEAGCVPC